MSSTDINTIILLTALISLCGCAMTSPKDKSVSLPKRILFIGNSYTGGIKNTLKKMIEQSQYSDTTLQFITPGGRTLKQHFEKSENRELIKSGNWDIVVLQDQSQTPALPGMGERSFHDSVDKFAKIIKDSGAKPVLYMTWGRKDGDQRNNFPDYSSMQEKLTEAYLSAAKRANAVAAPVGIAWADVRQKDKELGEALYTKDGSHPSNKGAYLVSCVFLRTLFTDSLETFECPEDLTEEEWKTIKKAALDAVL